MLYHGKVQTLVCKQAYHATVMFGYVIGIRSIAVSHHGSSHRHRLQLNQHTCIQSVSEYDKMFTCACNAVLYFLYKGTVLYSLVANYVASAEMQSPA